MNRKSGFTAAEVFMVLFLLVAVASILVTPVQRLVDQLNARPLEVIVLSAVRDAHEAARSRHSPVFLVNEAESNVLRIASHDGVTLAEHAYVSNADTDNVEVRFHRVLPGDPRLSAVVRDWEPDPIGSVLFDPCGVSVPFAICLREESREIRMVIDPFSGHPVEREEE